MKQTQNRPPKIVLITTLLHGGFALLMRGVIRLMIKILYNGKVHYARDMIEDPDVQEACARMMYEQQFFGKSLYSIDWGEFAEQPHEPDKKGGSQN